MHWNSTGLAATTTGDSAATVFLSVPTIPGELESTIPSVAAIGGATAVGSSAIGQGAVLASTLEMADVGATIAMGGRRPIPTLPDGAKPQFVDVTSR